MSTPDPRQAQPQDGPPPHTQAGRGGKTVSREVSERFADLSRELSRATVLFHAQVAGRVGLSATDHKCLDLAVQAHRPLTAGQIAELSGLSTGAVTGVIDRLERSGFVRRVRDQQDRRKVLVEVTRGSLARYGDVFDGLIEALESALADYTPAELAVVERYAATMIETMRIATARLAEAGRPTT